MTFYVFGWSYVLMCIGAALYAISTDQSPIIVAAFSFAAAVALWILSEDRHE